MHYLLLSKKHKQHGIYRALMYSILPNLQQIMDFWDKELRIYFSKQNTSDYEDEISYCIDNLQILFDLLDEEPKTEQLSQLSDLLKFYIKKSQDL